MICIIYSDSTERERESGRERDICTQISSTGIIRACVQIRLRWQNLQKSSQKLPSKASPSNSNCSNCSLESKIFQSSLAFLAYPIRTHAYQVKSRHRRKHIKSVTKKKRHWVFFFGTCVILGGLLEKHNFFKCQDGIFLVRDLEPSTNDTVVERYLSICPSLKSEIRRTNICKLTISQHLTAKEIPPSRRLDVLLEIEIS